MLDFFRDGGPFMYPLGIWSILVLGFFIERAWTFARLRSEEELAAAANDVTERIDSGASFDQLNEYCLEMAKLEGEVFASGIERFEHLTREERTTEEMRAEMNGTVERAALSYLVRYLSIIQFVASSAILLGLLGVRVDFLDPEFRVLVQCEQSRDAIPRHQRDEGDCATGRTQHSALTQSVQHGG